MKWCVTSVAQLVALILRKCYHIAFRLIDCTERIADDLHKTQDRDGYSVRKPDETREESTRGELNVCLIACCTLDEGSDGAAIPFFWAVEACNYVRGNVPLRFASTIHCNIFYFYEGMQQISRLTLRWIKYIDRGVRGKRDKPVHSFDSGVS